MDRRAIEDSFPVKEVSEYSAHEKNIRHGHISTLHIWWARRPLASSRTTAYAALVPAPDSIEQWQKLQNFIVELAKWENSLNEALIRKARRDIYTAHAERLSRELGRRITVEDIEQGRFPPPRVLDPFAGGGAIPLEALRLGCEVHAGDYNPVATLILKATLEFPQKFSRFKAVLKSDELVSSEQQKSALVAAVEHWGSWVLHEAKKELERFYPKDSDGSIPVGYIWARTIPCQNPSCGAEIPLMRQFWLAKKKNQNRFISLLPIPDRKNKRVLFAVVQLQPIKGSDEYVVKKVLDAPSVEESLQVPEKFNPSRGTIRDAIATCPLCGSTVPDKKVRRLFQEGKSGQRLVAVALTHPDRKGKTYRLANNSDLKAYQAAQEYLNHLIPQLRQKWGIEPVPDEPLPPVGTLGFRIQRYGMARWGDLFNARQKLALLVFTDKIREAYEKMQREDWLRQLSEWGIPQELHSDFAAATTTYLALGVDRIADRCSLLCRVIPQTEAIGFTYGRQALPMLWDYIEMCPVVHSAGWAGVLKEITANLLHFTLVGDRSEQKCSDILVKAGQINGINLPYKDDSFDAVFTDPPYYDNVPYSYLSDFFYVWLKRSVGHLYPDLFVTPLTPKKDEIVAYTLEEGGFEAGKRLFEERLGKAFREIHRVLKPNGVAVIVYAHKSTSGWEAVVNALLDSGLVITGAWPIDTEMKERLRAQESATLASSIYIVARKLKRQSAGFYSEVKEQLRRHLEKKLQRLWEEGVSGADFFVAGIGSAIEVFGKYEKVMDYEGRVLRAEQLLQDVRTIVTDFAVRQILKDGFAAEVSGLTRFYVLWRWQYGEAKVEFDEARKLAQSCGIDLTEYWNKRTASIRKTKEFVKVLGPQERKLEDVLKAVDAEKELIDVLHAVLLLWEKGRQDELVGLLSRTGYGLQEAFFRVAQAVTETIPIASKEKKLLDGFLAGRQRVQREVEKRLRQKHLF